MPASNIPWDQALFVLQILSLFRYEVNSLLLRKQSKNLREQTPDAAA